MDKRTDMFQRLVIRMLKMILFMLTYEDFREADHRAIVNIEAIQQDAHIFITSD